ncbi:prepilin peptidase [Dethiobacter alkaliphilus]|uniref:Prepilin leader peptidase/N-methyltransferase n=1 Tax=Dethiobacter alkaliphilus AHT 1 TaxID=555088 RepID=C0GE54_DETAL|nr:A24 family peptidase [Dethiobacter alkaliphilus]EEG78348.1 peptidase A24A domain protein [Dethiobacter alkaliphilus AHT 1]
MWLVVFVFGLFIGSFLNVCIWRIPREESVVFPPSHCTGCGRRLGALELIPVLSFLWQRGRCAGCGAEVSWRYPAVELASAVMFVLLFLRFGWPEFVIHAVFFAILLVIFFIDIDHQIIPNRLVLLLLGYSLLIQVVWPQVAWSDALLGGLLGGGLFLFLAVVSGGGMGGGDIKLVAVLGLWYGWAQLLLLMFLAFLGGGLIGGILLILGIKKRKDGIPFGPFLVLAAFVVTMWGRQLLEWYLRISGL